MSRQKTKQKSRYFFFLVLTIGTPIKKLVFFFFLISNHGKHLETFFAGVTGVFFNFGVEVGVEKSIVNAPPDYNSDQLCKSNLTFCVACVSKLQFEKSVFLKRVVRSQSTLQRQPVGFWEIVPNSITAHLLAELFFAI
jgi:hypothetical protein